MTPKQREELITEALTAHRETLRYRILPHRSWMDLDDVGREQLFEDTVTVRSMEAALDSDGLSTTAHAVLAKIRTGRG